MLKYAANLSDDYELAIVFWGQSNSRPWGAENEAFNVFQELELEDAGANMTIPPGTFAAEANGISRVPVISANHGLQTVTILTDVWIDAKLFLGETEDPRLGHGTVVGSSIEILPGTGVGSVFEDDFITSLGHTARVDDVIRLETPSPTPVGGLPPQVLSLTTTASDIDTGNNKFVTSSAHGLVDGDRVTIASSGAFPTTSPQISATSVLFVEQLNTTEFEIYLDTDRTVQVLLDIADGGTLTWTYDSGWVNGKALAFMLIDSEVDAANNQFTQTGHGLRSGDRIRMSSDSGGPETAGAFVTGRRYVIVTIGTTDFTLIGATANTVGLEFVATGAGSGTGTAVAPFPTTTPQITMQTSLYVKQTGANDFQLCTDATLEVVITIESGINTGTTIHLRHDEIEEGGHYVVVAGTGQSPASGADVIAIAAAYGGTRMLFKSSGILGEGGNKATWQISRVAFLEVQWSQEGETAESTGDDLGPWADKAWVVHEQEKWKSHKSVRVLTPYTPEISEQLRTETPQLPGGSSNPDYTVPAGITSHEDFGLFLNYTWVEGVDGSGIAGVGAAGGAGGVTVFAGTRIDEILAGSHVRVDVFDSAGDILRRVYADVLTSTKDAGLDVPFAEFNLDNNQIVFASLPTTGSISMEVNASLQYVRSVGSFVSDGFLPGMEIIATGFTGGNNATKRIASVTATVITVTDTAGMAVEVAAGGRDLEADHGLTTGQRFYFSQATPTTATPFPESVPASGAAITVIDERKPLFAIRVDKDTIQIATTYKKAIQGIVVDITKAPTAALKLHASTVLTVSAWTPAGDFTAGGATFDVQVFRDHWLNNPYAKTAGPGFRHPNHEPQPFPYGGIYQVHDTPKGSESNSTGTDYAYSNSRFRELTRIGGLLPMAWKLAQAIGKRVNVIHLGINSSGIYEMPGRNQQAGQKEAGWWDPDKFLDWNPNRTDGNAARLKKMIETMATAALTAEGNTKPLKVIAVVGAQGEAETITKKPRDNYENALPMFYEWLTKTIFEATNTDGSSLSYYSDPGKMPVCHWGLPSNPWELDAAAVAAIYGLSVSEVASDTEKVVNKVIANLMAKRPFGCTIDTESSPKLDNVFLGTDPLHFNGEGFVINGIATADVLLQTIDAAAASEDDDLAHPIIRKVCDLALSYVGEKTGIESLDPKVDSSMEAEHCARVFAPAREMLLQRIPWSFASARGELVPLDDTQTSEWSCAYGIPDNAVRVFSILPKDAGDDHSISIKSVGLILTSAGRVRQETAQGYSEQPFTVGRDDDGYLVIYTNVDNAIGRWTELVVDPEQWPPQFCNALAYQMASMLAGTIVRGEEGAALSQRMKQLMEYELALAEVSDAYQSDKKPKQVVPWLAARRSSVRRY